MEQDPVSSTASGTRRPRADQQRNRCRLLEAAKVVFGAGGTQASLETVAQTAGVGIGTLYRHFPNRQALFEAVYRREVDDLVARAADLQRHADPVEALRLWLRAEVEFVATKRGMAAALAIVSSGTSELTTSSSKRLEAALGGLLGRAREEDLLRTEVEAGDLLRAVIGMCLLHDRPGWVDGVLRLVDVMVEGLRRNGARP